MKEYPCTGSSTGSTQPLLLPSSSDGFLYTARELTLNMSWCLWGGCAGESTGACSVNWLEKFPVSTSSEMYGRKGGGSCLASTLFQSTP